MIVRPAVPEDARSVAVVHVEAWRAAYLGLVPQNYLDGLSVDARAAMWQRVLSETGPARCLVALDADGRLQGFCGYGPSRDEDAGGQAIGEVMTLYVHPGHWRAGVGRALWSQVVAAAGDAGWQDLTLWVLAGNAAARRFYEGLGLRADGAEKRSSQLTGSELHEVRYRLRLGSSGEAMT